MAEGGFAPDAEDDAKIFRGDGREFVTAPGRQLRRAGAPHITGEGDMPRRRAMREQ